MMAVLDAAAETRSPVIIQVSVKTVKFWGARLIQQTFADSLPNGRSRPRFISIIAPTSP